MEKLVRLHKSLEQDFEVGILLAFVWTDRGTRAIIQVEGTVLEAELDEFEVLYDKQLGYWKTRQSRGELWYRSTSES